MNVHSFLAIQSFGNGAFNSYTNTTLNITWPDDALDQIGLLHMSGLIAILENGDPTLKAVSVRIRSGDKLLAVQSLAKESPYAKLRQNCIVGYSEKIFGYLPENTDPTLYWLVDKSVGLQADVQFQDHDVQFDQERLEVHIAMMFSYVDALTIPELIPPPPPPPPKIVQLETVYMHKDVSHSSFALALYDDGTIKEVEINPNDGSVVDWTNITGP